MLHESLRVGLVFCGCMLGCVVLFDLVDTMGGACMVVITVFGACVVCKLVVSCCRWCWLVGFVGIMFLLCCVCSWLTFCPFCEI